MAKWLLAALIAASVMLAGCTASAVTISGQGGAMSSTKEKTLQCDGGGQVAVGIQGGGSLTVTVFDGDDDIIFSDSFSGGGQSGQAQSVKGVPGEWTLKVRINGGFGGQYSVTLSC